MNVTGIVKTAEIVLRRSMALCFGAHMVEFALGIERTFESLPTKVEIALAKGCEKKGLALIKTGPRGYTITGINDVESARRHYMYIGTRIRGA